MTASYEDQLRIVRDLSLPSSDDDRHITWCIEPGPIGVALTSGGLIEIFLEGSPLAATTRRVQDALDYQRWYRHDGSELWASRILLPAAGHYEQVAAFLCTELLRNGAVDDLDGAFARTEPLIDLAIHDLHIADEAFLGLCGEVLLLHALANAAPADQVGSVIDSWKGYRDSPRDFQLGLLGIEVKTTTGSVSSHRFSGVHQLEPGHGVDGMREVGYMVVSMGLEWCDSDGEPNATSLPQLVDGLLERIRTADERNRLRESELLRNISAYGRPRGSGYDHHSMADSTRYGKRFRLQFVRGYDMTDGSIRLLSTEDFQERPFLDPTSIRVRVNLPTQVAGDINPIVGLNRCAQRALESIAR